MIEEWYYIIYWTGVAVGISGLLYIASGYDPNIGTRLTLTGASSLLIAISAGGLVLTVRDMLSPKRANHEEET